MKKKENTITKTERILAVYHLLYYCEAVSAKDLSECLPGWCKKTFSRDIVLLKRAGVQVQYSKKRQAFELSGERAEACFSESKSETRYIKKIMRLTKMIDDMPEEDCGKWYAETFPDSKRTMERDFATLNAIGYKIKYERESFNSHNAGFDLPPRRYYCDRPGGAYELKIFRRG